MRAVKQGTLCVAALAASLAAMAGTVHHVKFAQPAQILVWEAGTLVARGNLIDLPISRSTAHQPLAGSGTLMPPNDTDARRMRIAVASNTAFSLTSRDAFAGKNVEVRILGTGENARIQRDASSNNLFRQSAKTAARRGHPVSQAIELEISWSSDTPPDLVLVAD